MSDKKKWLFRAPSNCSFVKCNTLLSLDLVLHAVWSSSWQVSHDLGQLQHLGVSSEIQASPLQLHVMASLGLHPGILLIYVWPQQLSLAMERSSITPFLYPWVQSQNHMAKAAKFCCLLGLEHGPLLAYISSAFCFLQIPLLLKLLFNSLSQVASLPGWGLDLRLQFSLSHLELAFSLKSLSP